MRGRFDRVRFLAGRRMTTGASIMITHQHGLLAPSARPVPSSSEETDRERERLRRELLRRIIDRETRRQASRSIPR
jgi:hypothetical protein